MILYAIFFGKARPLVIDPLSCRSSKVSCGHEELGNEMVPAQLAHVLMVFDCDET